MDGIRVVIDSPVPFDENASTASGLVDEPDVSNVWVLDDIRYNQSYANFAPVHVPNAADKENARNQAMSVATEDAAVTRIQELWALLCSNDNAGLEERALRLVNKTMAELANVDTTAVDTLFQGRVLEMELAINAVRDAEHMSDRKKTDALSAARAVIDLIIRLNDYLNVCLGVQKTMQAARSGELVSDIHASWRYMPINPDHHPNKLAQLYQIVFERARKRGYARYKDSFMRRVVTPAGLMTNAWERVSTILEFCYAQTRDPDSSIHVLTNSSVNIMENVAELLTKKHETDLPRLTPDRHVFAFRNGCYLADKEFFITFSQCAPPTMPDGSCCPTACKYHDVEIDPRWLTCADCMSIPTPLMDLIMNSQELTPDVRRVYFGMLGRAIYNLDEMDNWQVFLYIKGTAETGKTTLYKFISEFYNSDDVGVLSNNIEAVFGASMLADKFMVIGDDLGENFALDQQLFQNMCSGNMVSLPQKNKQALVIKWKAQLLLSGNVLPSYRDNCGSFSRRLCIVHYAKPVTAPDPNLTVRMRPEIGAAIIKCNRMYRNMVRRLQAYSVMIPPVMFWQAIPEEFRIQRNNVIQCSNPFMSFLGSGRIIYGKNYYMPRDLFVRELNEYCQNNNIAKPKFLVSHYEGPFNIKQLRITKRLEQKPYPRNTTNLIDTLWIIGCDIHGAPLPTPDPAQQQQQQPSTSKRAAPTTLNCPTEPKRTRRNFF